MPRSKPQPVPPLSVRQQPGLSVTLPFPRSLDTCQSCGQTADPSDGVALGKWREFDMYDQPTRVLVILCRPCADRLIDPHPRIYGRVDHFDPWPGAMELCVGCRYQEALRCTCPRARINGGPGILVTAPAPTPMHLNFGGGRGAFKKHYSGPATACDGRGAIAVLDTEISR